MADREKVIRQWEGIIDQIKQGNMRRNITTTMIYDTFDLLKEQEPIEPIVVRVNELDSLFRCGGCGAYVLFRKQKYCHACGRKVDWNA